MSTDVHDVGGLGAYALGALVDDERRILEDHLVDCARCRHELAQLQQTVTALDDVPPEMFMDGPPDDAGLLLQRALWTTRREASQRIAGRRAGLAAYVAAAVIAAAVGGIFVGRIQGRDMFPVSPPSSATASAQPSGVRVGSNTDQGTGAAMAVTLTPAAGWVRVNAAVSGIPAGQRCRLWVVARDGTRREAGSWLVSEKGAKEGTTLDGSAIIEPDQVVAVAVDNFDGDTFVSVPV
jgi:anti-sigma-K factor RskA